MLGGIGAVHFPADDLAAVQVKDQVQVEPAARRRREQISHIPTPYLLPPIDRFV